MRDPLLDPISFISMQFSAKILSNNRSLTQTQGLSPVVWEILDPSLDDLADYYLNSRRSQVTLGL